jgi:hypothetical protein
MALYYSTAISSCISGLSSAAIIAIYSLNERIRRTDIGEFILILQSFDFGVSVSLLLPTYFYTSNSILCLMQTLCLQTCNLAEVLWSGYITYVLYQLGIKGREKNSISKRKACFFIVLASLLSGIGPIAAGAYGFIGEICWINLSDIRFSILLRFLCLYLHLWIVFLYNLYVFRKISAVSIHDKRHLMFYKATRFYPYAIFITNAPLTIYECLLAFGISDNNNVLAGFVSWSRMLGLFNTIIFGYNKDVRKILTRRFLISREESEHSLPNLQE